MTSSPHGPYIQGNTRSTMVGTKGRQAARWSQSQKTDLSSDWGLQLDPMKLELLVIADQHAAVNTFPGLVHTARQAMKANCTRSRRPNPQGEANPKSLPQFRLQSATRLHEVGIASNRGSACRGESVPGPCTHRPSSHGSQMYPKSFV